MIFGSERAAIETSPLRKIIWTLRGDFHLGRWARYFYLRKILTELRIKPPENLLDAGCGEGEYAFFFEKKYKRAVIDAADTDVEKISHCLKVAKAIGSKINFFVSDLSRQIWPLKYDMIILTNVLYAIPDYEQTMRNLAGSVRRGGFLILQDMDFDFLKGTSEKTEKTVHDAVRMGFNLKELESFLARLNFEILRSQNNFGPPADFAHRCFGKLRKHPILMNLFLPFLIFLVFLDSLLPCKRGAGIMIVGQKK
jgi:ubiquinone/menaquinone biosynthesis C-methylase UbiE